jgi:hypothetical protein
LQCQACVFTHFNNTKASRQVYAQAVS